jgi:hypothetical protein
MTPPLVDHLVRVNEISWSLEPLPRAFEAVDTLGLDECELFEYVGDLQRECGILRVLLHEALAALARANVEMERYHARVADLLGELRSARHEIHTLRAQVRAMQDNAA